VVAQEHQALQGSQPADALRDNGAKLQRQPRQSGRLHNGRLQLLHCNWFAKCG
jgi:hypothetical protein